MKTSIPSPLTQGLSDNDRNKVLLWWRELSETVQTQVVNLCDARWDNPSLAMETVGNELNWHALPIQLSGRLVDEETQREDRMARQQLFDYVVNHEDIVFFLEERKYHICRAHSAARAVVRKGFLAASFECPLGNETGCPMRVVLDDTQGRSVQFVVRINLHEISPQLVEKTR